MTEMTSDGLLEAMRGNPMAQKAGEMTNGQTSIDRGQVTSLASYNDSLNSLC